MEIVDSAYASITGRPYSADKVNESWSCVTNASGVNCLAFKHKPGAIFTDHETAIQIAELWNRETA